MGIYIKLVDINSATEKERNFGSEDRRYISRQEQFLNVPGYSFAYWIKQAFLEVYTKAEKIDNYIDTFQGIISGNNDKMLHLWYEININNMLLDVENMESVNLAKTYWIPYNKGGEFRKWYGVQDYVIYWGNGPDDKTRGRKTFSKYYLKEYVAWSYTVANSIAMRYYPKGFLWDVRGSGIFGSLDDILYLQGLISSKVGYAFFRIDSSVMSCQVENILNMPVIIVDKNGICSLVKDNIQIAKEEWDSFEISWKFSKHPMLESGEKNMAIRIEDKFVEYKQKCEQRFVRLKENEIELNRRFIAIYGLEREIDSAINDEDITVRKANLQREIKSLISYAVGCIMGRYSLKEDGLIYAGGEWDNTRYSEEFKPCEYGVMPITEEQYFEEDLCTRVIDFIKVVYGEDTLTENLKFIASALKPGSFEAPKKVIREYLFNGFFDNHYQIYQHRPIYWQLDSGKAGGFRAIVYMHRYSENTLPIVRTEYIQELRYKYEEEMQRLQHRVVDATTTAEKNAIKKEITAIDKKLVECTAYDDLLNHATSNIKNYTFDLDDGVKTNYAKFLSVDGDKSKNILTVIKL